MVALTAHNGVRKNPHIEQHGVGELGWRVQTRFPLPTRLRAARSGCPTCAKRVHLATAAFPICAGAKRDDSYGDNRGLRLARPAPRGRTSPVSSPTNRRRNRQPLVLSGRVPGWSSCGRFADRPQRSTARAGSPWQQKSCDLGRTPHRRSEPTLQPRSKSSGMGPPLRSSPNWGEGCFRDQRVMAQRK
jgi:hypothetical protein